ncbi:MAG: DUF2892 domain-containing protein [Solirubrobacterales bacterium]
MTPTYEFPRQAVETSGGATAEAVVGANAEVVQTAAAQAPAPTAATWPLERVLFALAGTVSLLSATLAAFVSPWFLLLTVFAGVNQLLFASVGVCGASLLLTRFTGLKPAIRTKR